MSAEDQPPNAPKDPLPPVPAKAEPYFHEFSITEDSISYDGQEQGAEALAAEFFLLERAGEHLQDMLGAGPLLNLGRAGAVGGVGIVREEDDDEEEGVKFRGRITTKTGRIALLRLFPDRK